MEGLMIQETGHIIQQKQMLLGIKMKYTRLHTALSTQGIPAIQVIQEAYMQVRKVLFLTNSKEKTTLHYAW